MLHADRTPARAILAPAASVRALRSALRMSQAQLSRRSKVPQAHIARLEAGLVDAQLSTLVRLFDAMFCGLVVLPRPRKRPSEALGERQAERPHHSNVWD